MGVEDKLSVCKIPASTHRQPAAQIAYNLPEDSLHACAKLAQRNQNRALLLTATAGLQLATAANVANHHC